MRERRAKRQERGKRCEMGEYTQIRRERKWREGEGRGGRRETRERERGKS